MVSVDSNAIISKYEIKELFLAIGLGNPSSIVFQTASSEISIHNVSIDNKRYWIKASLRNVKYDKSTHDPIVNELTIYKSLEESESTRYQKIVYSDITKKYIDVNFIVIEIVGIPYKKKFLGYKERKLIMYQVGEQLARLHKIEGLGFGSEKIGIENSWESAYKKLVDDIISKLTVQNVRVDTNRIYSAISRVEPILKDVNPSLIHADLWKGNIYISPSGAKFMAFSGWENSMWGDLATDFVRLNPIRGTMNNKNFMRGYLSVNEIKFDKNFHIRRNLMKLFMGLNALIYPIAKWRLGAQKYIYKRIEGRVMVFEALRFLEKVQMND